MTPRCDALHAKQKVKGDAILPMMNMGNLSATLKVVGEMIEETWALARTLERECFKLAATQCSHPILDEHGHQACARPPDRSATQFYVKQLERDRAELLEALKKFGRHGENCLGDLSSRVCSCGFDTIVHRIEGRT